MHGFIYEPAVSGGSALVVQEVVITFAEKVPSGTAINIQTGSYAGQVNPPTVEGTTTLTLPVTFNTDASLQVILNGSELKKPEDASRTSSTQLTLSDKVKNGAILKVRSYS